MAEAKKPTTRKKAASKSEGTEAVVSTEAMNEIIEKQSEKNKEKQTLDELYKLYGTYYPERI